MSDVLPKEVKMIKDLRVALKEFEPMVKDPKHLWNGRDIKNFSLRPREAWGNWLICAVLQKLVGEGITFVEDDEGDGVIYDRNTGGFINTEHVSALDIPKGKKLPTGEQKIIHAIDLKIAKGEEYAEGKSLVVFFDGAGSFVRKVIRENIYGRHHFNSIFCVGLLTAGSAGYVYMVCEFSDSFGDQSITHNVEINADFTDWAVVQLKA